MGLKTATPPRENHENADFRGAIMVIMGMLWLIIFMLINGDDYDYCNSDMMMILWGYTIW